MRSLVWGRDYYYERKEWFSRSPLFLSSPVLLAMLSCRTPISFPPITFRNLYLLPSSSRGPKKRKKAHFLPFFYHFLFRCLLMDNRPHPSGACKMEWDPNEYSFGILSLCAFICVSGLLIRAWYSFTMNEGVDRAFLLSWVSILNLPQSNFQERILSGINAVVRAYLWFLDREQCKQWKYPENE